MNTVKSAVAVLTTGLLWAGTAVAQPATPSPPSGAPPSGDVKQQQRQGTAPATPGQRTQGVTDEGAKRQADKPDTMSPAKGAKDRMAAPADADHVRQVQQALKDKGHDPGPIDGVVGSQTKAALKSYQQAEGLKATGRLDAQTMAKLGVSDAPSASPPGAAEAEKQKRGGDVQSAPPGRRKQTP
jgi:peptidoglycan hydrolase-like protein with peptidoglycan-binding domain